MMQQALLSALGEIGCDCAEKQVISFIGSKYVFLYIQSHSPLMLFREAAIRQRVAECLGNMSFSSSTIQEALHFLSKDSDEAVAEAACRALLKQENNGEEGDVGLSSL
jgi:hypothetical protein